MKNDIKVYGIVGKARHGKDTVADILKDNLVDSVTLYHAKHLKDVACLNLALGSIEELDYYKNNNIKYHGVDIRKYLQQLADTLRAGNENIFIDELNDQIATAIAQGYLNIIITDVRYIRELDNLKRNAGSSLISIKVIRPNIKDIESSNHSSETEVDTIVTEYTVYNDGTLNDLEQKIKNKFIYN